MTGERSCRTCRTWYDRRLQACPQCATEPPGFNKWLRTAELNNHLYSMAENAAPRKEYERAYKHYRKAIGDAVARF